MRPTSRTEGGMTVLDISSSTPRRAETRQEATYRLVIASAQITWPDSDSSRKEVRRSRTWRNSGESELEAASGAGLEAAQTDPVRLASAPL